SWHALLSILEAIQSEQSANQFVQAAGFEFNTLEHARALRSRALPGQAQRHIQAGKRGTQLMRNVVQKTRLRLHQGLHPSGHGIEVANESRDLVAPSTPGVA